MKDHADAEFFQSLNFVETAIMSQGREYALIADEKSPARISHRIVIAVNCTGMDD